MPPNPLVRLRKICLGLPETHEVEAWGEATFRVRKKMFAMFANKDTHHGAGRNGVWLKASSENQSLMVAANPDRFFVPPYVGVNGWIGVRLDSATDWKELAALVCDGYRLVAPKKLAALVPATEE